MPSPWRMMAACATVASWCHRDALPRLPVARCGVCTLRRSAYRPGGGCVEAWRQCARRGVGAGPACPTATSVCSWNHPGTRSPVDAGGGAGGAAASGSTAAGRHPAYELVTGHPDRTPQQLVFTVDLAVELPAWPADTWRKVGVDPQAAALAVIAGWRRGVLPAGSWVG